MAYQVNSGIYSIKIPHTEQGLRQGCEELTQTLKSGLSRAVTIDIIFESQENPTQIHSAVFERRVSRLTFKGLDETYKSAIRKVFAEQNIRLSDEVENTKYAFGPTRTINLCGMSADQIKMFLENQ